MFLCFWFCEFFKKAGNLKEDFPQILCFWFCEFFKKAGNLKEDFSRYLEIVLQIVFDVISVYLSGFHLILECHFINFNVEKGETSEISSLWGISLCRIILPDDVTFLDTASYQHQNFFSCWFLLKIRPWLDNSPWKIGKSWIRSKWN